MNRINRSKPKTNTQGYLIYPLDMKSNDNKMFGQDRIEFTSLQYAKKLEGNDNAKEDNKLRSPDKNDPSQTKDPQNIVFQKLTTRINEKDQYKPSPLNLGGKFSSIERIYLPIQDKIQDQNAVQWEGGELGELQRMLANLSYNIMSGKGNIPESSVNAAEQLLKDPNFGNKIRLGLVGEAISVQNLLTRATGSIANPNLELLFSKPTLRPFVFNFKLSPRNADEGEMVKGIIKFFKMGMAPRLDQTSTLFVKSPRVFKVKYLMGNSKDHPGLNLIKTCAIQNCNVDYTPNNSYMTYKDGTMISYNINLTMQELVPVYDIDYIKNEEFDRIDHPIGY
jgi:hypothetical protein